VVAAYAVAAAGLQDLRAAAAGAALFVWSRGQQLAQELAAQVDGVLERGMTFREVVDEIDLVRARHAQRTDAGQQ
jgi:hypothetical protein